MQITSIDFQHNKCRENFCLTVHVIHGKDIASKQKAIAHLVGQGKNMSRILMSLFGTTLWQHRECLLLPRMAGETRRSRRSHWRILVGLGEGDHGRQGLGDQVMW